MNTIHKIALFMNHYRKQLQRKWHTLPLLLLFPFVIIGISIFLIITYISPDEDPPLQIGLLDLDRTDETEIVMQLLEESSQYSSFMQLEKVNKDEAEKGIESNRLSAYITFPEDFVNDLYNGHSVTLKTVGNPEKPTESRIVHELMESVSRHIRSAQASILTIAHYAKDMPIGDEERQDMLFEEFRSFFFGTLAKDDVLEEKEVPNAATSAPLDYYGTSAFFILLTIWLFLIFNVLMEEESKRMKQRMRLYGVTPLQRIYARMIISVIVAGIFAGVCLYGLSHFLNWELYFEDYGRITFISVLYSLILLHVLGIMETLVDSRKVCLLLQSAVIIVLLGISGAFIPVIYFPEQLQSIAEYLFMNDAFYWLTEIIVNARFYADFTPLMLMSGIGVFLLLALSVWKERVRI